MQDPVRTQPPWALRAVPPFPVIAQRVLGLVNQDDTSAREVSDVVKLDPSFAASLLRLANSALFGFRREVRSLQQAISLVGLDRIKTIATVVAMDRMVRSSVNVEALRKIWIHTLVTAMVAEEAARLNHMDREAGYTGGLLHNLGALGLMSSYPAEYARMLEVSNAFGFDLLATERDLFEIDHCLAGCYLAQDWNFPDELAAAIAGHHDDPVAGEATMDNLLRVSWRLADSLGFAAFSPAKEWRYDELLAFLPNTGSWLGESAETARREVDERLSSVPV